MMRLLLISNLALDGMMMFENVSYRRELDISDLERMRIPRRYWNSKFDDISESIIQGSDLSPKKVVEKYISNMSEMRKSGCGFIFFGNNGVGKSCMSVVIAREYRRRGYTVLFMEAADLKRMVIEKEYFDDDDTYWDRFRSVDVLVLDDFGKGIMDTTGFGASLFDELIRARNSRKLVTIITTNLPVSEWQKELDLKKSTMSSLKECVVPVHVVGVNKRTDREIVKLLEI